MSLPFTEAEFLDLFGAYNTSLWAAVAALWAVTAIVAAVWLRRGFSNGTVVFGLLSFHWMWSGLVYHETYFRPLNPVATYFGVAFVAEGVALAWVATRRTVAVGKPAGLRGAIAAAFVAYGLAYPVVGLALGLVYPRLPLFAVPCPTTLVTTGFLLAASGPPRAVRVVPIVWAMIGTSAALTLGIGADLALGAAAAALALDLLVPARLRLATVPRT